MQAVTGFRLRSAAPVVRIGLAAFVLAWVFGLFGLRSAIPVWLPFLVALGLEVQFFLGATRTGGLAHDRGPQDVDRERYGYAEEDEAEDLLLVRRGGEDYWLPYSGENVDELDVDALIAEAIEREEQEAAAPEPEPEPPRRPWRQLLVGLGVIAVLAGVAWVGESRAGWGGLDADTRAEAAERFSDEASRIAEHRVSIRCDESGAYVGAVQHADGVASIGGSLAYLTPERCLDLYRLAFEDEVNGSQTGRAVAVLAHESWHLRGIRDEGTTECYALQSGVELGQRLGLSEGRARQLMRQQLAENALHGGGSAEYVVSPECRNGGELDLHPESSAFP